MREDSSIKHVSDTAFWVASFRAQEGRRSDAAFEDPLAFILSGERGRQIARSMPRAAKVEWGMVVRTSAVDRLIYAALRSGVDTVLNLGAGLDTRPYRLNLPGSLRWIEVDFPKIVAWKNFKLEEYRPACELERVAMDLLDLRSREALLARYAIGSKNTLVITEGVISYFSIHEVAALADELAAIASIRFWIQDFDNAGKRRSPRGWERKLKAAPLQFAVKDWFEFFGKYGWRSSQVITSFEESQRINRPYPVDFPFGVILHALPKTMRQEILSLSGAVLMQSGCHATDREK